MSAPLTDPPESGSEPLMCLAESPDECVNFERCSLPQGHAGEHRAHDDHDLAKAFDMWPNTPSPSPAPAPAVGGLDCTHCEWGHAEIERLRAELERVTKERDDSRAYALNREGALDESQRRREIAETQRDGARDERERALAMRADAITERDALRAAIRQAIEFMREIDPHGHNGQHQRKIATLTAALSPAEGEGFCACGRRVSECDGSRAGCGKEPTP